MSPNKKLLKLKYVAESVCQSEVCNYCHWKGFQIGIKTATIGSHLRTMPHKKCTGLEWNSAFFEVSLIIEGTTEKVLQFIMPLELIYS